MEGGAEESVVGVVVAVEEGAVLLAVDPHVAAVGHDVGFAEEEGLRRRGRRCG